MLHFIQSKVLSKNKIKLIRSLDLKKYRLETGLFIAEGEKLVFDLLHSKTEISELFCTSRTAQEALKLRKDLKIEVVSMEDLSRISFLKTTPEIVAICKIPNSILNWDEVSNSLSLLLDEIQDPGNLGTIVRLADWFGIKNIFCSPGCADLYNPKVIQSTMGAFSRVNVYYTSLVEFLVRAKQFDIPVYGTYMEGENLYNCDLTPNGIIVMGNEGNGISDIAAQFMSKMINIPSYPPGNVTSESLNVAVATSVICAEFRRRTIYKD